MNPRSTAALAGAALAAMTLTACGSSPTPEPSSSPSGTARPHTVTLDVTTLPTGQAPKIAWLRGRELHDGKRTVTLDADVDSVVLTEERILTTRHGDTGTTIDVRGPDGRASASYPIGNGYPVLNPARTIVAWLDDSVTPWFLQDGEPKPVALPAPDGATAGAESHGDAVALLGRDCMRGPETVEDGGCSMYFNWYRDPKTQAYVASSHGFVDTIESKHVTELRDVSPQLGFLGDDGSGTLRFERGATGYVTKGYLPDTFSPDGSRFLALPGEATEGPVAETVRIRDSATGRQLVEARSAPDHVSIWQARWEDPSHVLAVVEQEEGEWAIVRFGVDGSAELAVPTVTDDGVPGLRLSVQP